MQHSTLLESVERVKAILVGVATGTRIELPIQREYEQLRLSLVNDQRVKKFLPSFVISCRQLNEFWGFIKPKFDNYAGRRNFLADEFNTLLTEIETGRLNASSNPSDESISLTLHKLESAAVDKIWKQAVDRRSSDPEGALTTARSLLESVIKHILDDTGEMYDGSDDLPKLYKKMASKLDLAPNTQTEPIFKQLLGSCHSLVEGIGAMRNKLSDAHGRGRTAISLDERHVELGVNMAGVLATFWVKTYKQKLKAPT